MPDIDFNGDGRGDVLWIKDSDVAVSNWLGTASGGFLITMRGRIFRSTGRLRISLCSSASASRWVAAWKRGNLLQ